MSERDESHQVLALARRLALEAGAIQRDRYESDFDIETKSASIDLVTEVDKQCEALIVEGIERERPGDAILAEEGGAHAREHAAWRRLQPFERRGARVEVHAVGRRAIAQRGVQQEIADTEQRRRREMPQPRS